MDQAFPALARGCRGDNEREASRGTGQSNQGHSTSKEKREGETSVQLRMCQRTCQVAGMCQTATNVASTITQNGIISYRRIVSSVFTVAAINVVSTLTFTYVTTYNITNQASQ